MKTKTNNRQGFTLLEIMACMVIISIVSSITLPAINNFRSSDRVKADGQLLVSAVRHAKYTALQDNVLIRIIFKDDGSFFKEQLYTYKTHVNEDGTLNNIKSINSIINDDNIPYEEANDSGTWTSISDPEETEFSSDTDVDIKELNEYGYTLYFKPDGYIYVDNNGVEKLSEVRVVFKHGSSVLAVDINSLGVLSSEAFTREDDDEDDGSYTEEDKVEW